MTRPRLGRMRKSRTTALVFLLVAGTAEAAGKGEGACVVRDTSGRNYAPLYRDDEGDKAEARAERGQCFGGVSGSGASRAYTFERKNGRVHVLYLAQINDNGEDRDAWMDEKDLEFFGYECGCDADCSPFGTAGRGTYVWNACFKEARDRKLAELKERWAGAAPRAAAAPAAVPAPQAAAPPASPTEKPLSNKDVIALSKAGLGDDLVVAKIQQAPSANLDVSTESLLALKKAGVSNAVIDAMMKRAGARR